MDELAGHPSRDAAAADRPGHVHATSSRATEGWTVVDTGLGLPDARERWEAELDGLTGRWRESSSRTSIPTTSAPRPTCRADRRAGVAGARSTTRSASWSGATRTGRSVSSSGSGATAYPTKSPTSWSSRARCTGRSSATSPTRAARARRRARRLAGGRGARVTPTGSSAAPRRRPPRGGPPPRPDLARRSVSGRPAGPTRSATTSTRWSTRSR